MYRTHSSLEIEGCQDMKERGSEPVKPSTIGPSYTIAPSIVSNPVNGVCVGRYGKTPLWTVERVETGTDVGGYS